MDDAKSEHRNLEEAEIIGEITLSTSEVMDEHLDHAAGEKGLGRLSRMPYTPCGLGIPCSILTKYIGSMSYSDGETEQISSGPKSPDSLTAPG